MQRRKPVARRITSGLPALNIREHITDLTQINVEINFTLDTTDVVLIVTTGGVGYLAKQFYQHVASRHERRRELEIKNYGNLIDLAVKRRAKKIFVRLHKDVPYFVPKYATEKVIAEDDDTRTVEFTFKHRT